MNAHQYGDLWPSVHSGTANSFTSSNFWIFPEGVLGKSLTIFQRLGT
ncbi:hypothetical protein HNQ99_003360, partial [Rhizorhapis suberifaciens]|nr:hypothetical protein [Rhizorhapis suberifaciens]